MTTPQFWSKSADADPIRFIEWKAVLEKESFSPEQRDLFREAIFRFLRYCKSTHTPASVASIRLYLGDGHEADRAALR